MVCCASEPDPNWDGTYARMESPSDSDDSTFVAITLRDCASTRFGSPNDEALCGHPLWGRGLEFYQARVVHNSSWLEGQIAINAVHEHQNDATWRSSSTT